MSKVAIIGAGNVGGTLAQRIAEADLADVVLLDVAEGVAQGKAFDLADARQLIGHDRLVIGTKDYTDISDADIVVVTAGLARQPGMTREDLLKKNTAIVSEISVEVSRHAAQAILIMVTNPLDVLTNIALLKTGFEPRQVVGMGGVLDASRCANLIAEALGVSAATVQAMVIGAHGENMLPLLRYSTVSGIPATELLTPEQQQRVISETTQRGARIVASLGKGSAYYAPSAAALTMIKAILHDEQKILPCCAMVDDVYGLEDVCIGVPVQLGMQGVEEIIELELTDEEQSKLQEAAQGIKSALVMIHG